MSYPLTLLLGFIAGATIVLGLPLGRLQSPAAGLRVFLNATAVGVLLFLFWDVLAAAWEPIDSALSSAHDGSPALPTAVAYGALFVAGLSGGLLGLVAYERYLARSRRPVRVLVGSGVPEAPPSPGSLGSQDSAAWSSARHLSFLIAVGIGLHNFAEGLAIGQSAAIGEIGLSTVLVIGFALHNATEGFGIVAPLAAQLHSEGPTERPTWRFLLAMAAIGGGPTFLGTVVGHSVTSEPVSVAFLTLAAGSITYVIAQLLGVAARSRRRGLVAFGLLCGLVAGFLTDAIVTLAGA